MTDLPHFWHWDGDAAVYDGGGHLRCRVEIDEDDDVVITETWMGSTEAYEETKRYVPLEVMRAVLKRHAGRAAAEASELRRWAATWRRQR